jgi:Putative auto-transporter adhesin, head GIN domain
MAYLTSLLGLALCIATSMTNAQTFDISGCSSHLLIQQSNAVKEPQLDVTATAAAASQAKLRSSVQGWTLHCAQPTSNNSSSAKSTVISGVQINRAFGAGAVAQQNIGGRSNTASNTASSEQLKVIIPTGWRLSAKSWTGSLRAEAGVWQAEIELAAGDVYFSRLKNSKIVVDSGSVSVQDLAGDFHANLRGAGSIEVDRMQDTKLDLLLSGAGSMTFKGRAASAKIRATGVGSIEVEQVKSEPLIQSSGMASIDVGR